MPSAPRFFNPRADIDAHVRRLPHWRQDGVTSFVTWRLADALPAPIQSQWRSERDAWLLTHPKPWDEKTEAAYHRTFSDQFDAWLDAGSGSCLLRELPVRAHLDAALLGRHGVEYELHAFVVMPNHVHVLFSPYEHRPWERIVGAWKSISAHRINRAVGRRGALWQEESWDRMIRHAQQFTACRKYIRDNPIRARLGPDEYTLRDESLG